MNHRGKGSTLVIITAIIIFGVGYLTFQTFTNGLSDSSQNNLTTSIDATSTVFNIGGIVLMIGAMLAIIGIVYYYVSTPERYRKYNSKLRKIIQFLDTSTYYFGYGLLCLVILAIPSVLTWFLYQFVVIEGEGGSLLEVLKWIGLIVVLYFGIAGVGYVFKRKLVDKWKKRREENRYDMSELPGDTG